jgi:hypothetical protein
LGRLLPRNVVESWSQVVLKVVVFRVALVVDTAAVT